jgi:sulfur carrier protein ThiS
LDFLAKMVPEAKFEVKINAGATVEELLIVLTERFDEKFRRAILDRHAKLNADIAVVLDNHFIPPQQMTVHAIHESSNLSIIPIAGGG